MKTEFDSNELFVVFNYSEREISKVYTDKESAELASIEISKKYFKFYRILYNSLSDEKFESFFNSTIKKSVCDIITLSDAIELFKETLEEQITSLNKHSICDIITFSDEIESIK